MAELNKATSPAEHAAEVLKAKAARAIDNAQEKYGAAVDEVSVRAMQATDTVLNYANHAADALDDTVKTRPMTTVVGAVFLGFLMGAFWKR